MKLLELITRYVAFKQAMGANFTCQAGILRSFCRAMGDISISDVDHVAIEAFLKVRGQVTAYWTVKYKALSGFFRFLIARGYLDVSPLPATNPKVPERRTPHIYTLEELKKLITATDTLYRPSNSLRSATYRALLLTLYGTGMRIGEALSLAIADVDLSDDVIIVHHGKFHKSRLVPVGGLLAEQLRAYAGMRDKFPLPKGKDSAFFATVNGCTISYQIAKVTFSHLRTIAGICPDNSSHHLPRIHDLRHTFAVHRLEAWYREGADVQRLLPKLSTYLGHQDVSATQGYLTMIPELLQEASRRFERYGLRGVTHE